MCGILGGFFNKDADLVKFRESLYVLSHRGPDSDGIFKNNIGQDFLLFLGHRRLSIFDLSENGNQPFYSQNGRYAIIYNGEIYNFLELRSILVSKGISFKTNSDTEVLIEGWNFWGIEVLKKIKGMFSFAIFDKIENKLSLFRDAFGIKPLYFFHNENASEFIFSSEIPPILSLIKHDISQNYQVVYDYLIHGISDFGDKTFYDGIFRILPGCGLNIYLDANKNKIKLSHFKWWTPEIKENSKIEYQEAKNIVREKFLENIEYHLRSDVPVGFILSGGIDSSSVLYAAKHLYPDLKPTSFSYIDSSSKLSEEKWIDYVSKDLKSNSLKVHFHNDDFINNFNEVIASQGEPFGGTSIFAQYLVFEAVKKNNIVVTLDGQGADEILAGYTGYPKSVFRSFIEKRDYISGLRFLYHWKNWPGRSNKDVVEIISSVILNEKVKKIFFNFFKTNLTPDWINSNFFKENGVSFDLIDPKLEKENSKRRLSEKLKSEINGQGLQCLLRYSDRNSMTHSIENRVPFLTIDLVEFLLSLPENFLVSNHGQTKRIFRDALKDIVSPKILDRKDKIGFETSEDLILKMLKPQFQVLIEQNSGSDIFESFNLKNFLNKNFISNSNNSLMWRILNYMEWSKKS
jgi:asparagine synthase (glutamine-hydrolysing)